MNNLLKNLLIWLVVGLVVLTLPSLAGAADPVPKHGTFGKAKACILIFNYGGPSHIDTWDLKPDAPKEIRGEFNPAATK